MYDSFVADARNPSGRRPPVLPLPAPPELRQIEEGYTGPARIISVLERAADRQMARFAQQRDDPVGTRYEFAFRYGFDTIDLDQSYHVEREVRGDGS